jgi:hypothetical protein
MKHEKNVSHDILVEKDDVAYIRLEKFENRKVSKTVKLRDIIQDYKGADVMLDFTDDEVLIGIEIIA